jgi:hypothetical protein
MVSKNLHRESRLCITCRGTPGTDQIDTELVSQGSHALVARLSGPRRQWTMANVIGAEQHTDAAASKREELVANA